MSLVSLIFSKTILSPLNPIITEPITYKDITIPIVVFFPISKNILPEIYSKQNRKTEIIPDNNEGNFDFKLNISKEKEPKEINDISEINITGKIEITPIHT